MTGVTIRWSMQRELASPLRVFAGLGAAVVIAGLFIEPARVWANLLLAGFFLCGIGLGAVVFVGIHFATGAGWSTVVRRVAEALGDLIPLGAGLVVPAVFFGGPTLYPWWHGGEVHGFRAFWLTPSFMLMRALAYVGIWMVFLVRMRGHSIAQDAAGDLEHSRANARWSVAWLIVFGFTFSLASVDWIMSLEPKWFSTIFGAYHFAGLFTASLAVILIATIALRENGALRGVVGDAHLHDLGKLLFAFSTFWMYMWFSQYMLIWYGNLSEETPFFTLRSGAWVPVMVANVVLNWGVPFTLLLQSKAKRSARRLGRIAFLVLVGHWIDLYLSIHPAVFGKVPVFGVWEVAITMGASALAMLVVGRRLGLQSLVPSRDPFLEESLHHHG